ncbi:phage holin family protein [Pseudogemmobacter humi]|uniref:Holin-X, holin superfamily III n=1 Tax=Pseudogemmobacter humi TaxID=2483812 RepID=A0A3P5XHI9_9RHOB|nr:phage holin family protein [Pseudogemmobacter humi]VDC28008.1 hypothetical protein XINFAN_01963 [Pseudogemmobacter humi]
MSRDPQSGPGVSALILQILGGALRLMGGEIALARASARRAVALALRGLVLLALALVLASLALGQLADAGHAGLVAAGLGPLGASLTLGLGLLLLAGLLAWLGLRLIRAAPHEPRRSFSSLRRDIQTLMDRETRPETDASEGARDDRRA